jgi:hypothetical protein
MRARRAWWGRVRGVQVTVSIVRRYASTFAHVLELQRALSRERAAHTRVRGEYKRLGADVDAALRVAGAGLGVDVVEVVEDLACELREARAVGERAGAEVRELRGRVAALAAQAAGTVVSPVPMVLNCPACGARHVDRGEYASRPHHTHACQTCGVCWRPGVASTVGVQFLPGFRDDAEAASAVEACNGLVGIAEELLEAELRLAAGEIGLLEYETRRASCIARARGAREARGSARGPASLTAPVDALGRPIVVPIPLAALSVGAVAPLTVDGGGAVAPLTAGTLEREGVGKYVASFPVGGPEHVLVAEDSEGAVSLTFAPGDLRADVRGPR